VINHTEDNYRLDYEEYAIKYKILIVDDEIVEREVIQYLIKQNNFPLEVYEVENGEDALELMSEVDIDILFTDINMPFVDGITLATIVRKTYPDIHIVFFTGYDDFNYVKEALLLNIVNYILKPVNEDEFRNTLTSVLEMIQKEKNLIQTNTEKNKILHNHILQHIINGMEYSQLKGLYPFIDFSFLHRFHRVLIIQIKNDFGIDYSVEKDVVRAEKILKLLPADCLLHNSNPAEYVLLLTDTKKNPIWYEEFAEKITMQIQDTLNAGCHIAVSEHFSDPSEIFKAYMSTRKQLNSKFFEMADRFCGDNFANNNLRYEQGKEIDFMMKELQDAVKAKSSQNLKEIVAHIIHLLTVENKVSYLYFCYIMTSVIKMLLDVLPNEDGGLLDECMETIYHSTNIAEVESIMMHMIDNIVDKMEQASSFDHVISRIKTIIHTRYMEDMSLEILAKEVYLSPQYLSVIFVEKNGCGINKYIKNVRMYKAKELLESTNLKVSDICTMVGYNNFSYFCKCFAEEFGKTPKKYRESLYG